MKAKKVVAVFMTAAMTMGMLAAVAATAILAAQIQAVTQEATQRTAAMPVRVQQPELRAQGISTPQI